MDEKVFQTIEYYELRAVISKSLIVLLKSAIEEVSVSVLNEQNKISEIAVQLNKLLGNISQS